MDRACLAIVIASAVVKKRKKRRIWVKDWLLERDRYTHLNLLNEIVVKNPADFKNYFRMSETTFLTLLDMVSPHIKKQDTNMRQSISPKERLAVTLRYLATGRNFADLKFSALISPAAISSMIIETCETLIYVLRDYIKLPLTEEEWLLTAAEFSKNCHFPTCLGALDGKHIAIKKPANTSSLYYNYKGHFSIVLMALVNANKEFIMVDVGANGRISDGGVLFYTKFWDLFLKKQLHIPPPTKLPGSEDYFPYVFVADEAFALHCNLMKPYPQKKCTKEQDTFNKRLSTARCVVENAFGILASRFVHKTKLKA
ncbi:uncharacterized protein LOC130892260 [Diorhabda carinulata]|uniref:uncharacterized protein LOC130892260 n=1 Tax=Diorhabda carinulata TaxID=1163345 RepID=UPI0025A1F33D|nr:uncharacterized protein LOC130892260 [Diorhabda carinulata]